MDIDGLYNRLPINCQGLYKRFNGTQDSDGRPHEARPLQPLVRCIGGLCSTSTGAFFGSNLDDLAARVYSVKHRTRPLMPFLT